MYFSNVTNLVSLHDYQKIGIDWISESFFSKTSCMLADEMGLGKTLQSIGFLAKVADAVERKQVFPVLVICPLSVAANWMNEFERFCPKMKTVLYAGEKGSRENMQRELVEDRFPFDVMVTTYEVVLKDFEIFISTIPFQICILDEAHRLKNRESKFVELFLSKRFKFYLLLTGTPYQNEISEIFSLLQFMAPKDFPDFLTFKAKFASFTKTSSTSTNEVLELRNVLSKYMLRRLKSDVNMILPDKKEIVIFAGLSEMQKKFYKAIITKNAEALGSQNARGLINVVMQLRKCCNHPYLFAGAEPEPFMEGPHLYENSGKFSLLNKLLPYLKEHKHRVLLFSTSVQTLDIIQDYVAYKSYSYERLDGSVRGEERNSRVQAFSNPDCETFIFLLSTRAGGVGLNLTSADTVIFFDTDFNPQIDLQAAARVHRIGQKKPVTIIRLVTRNTAEEIIFRRTLHKLRRTMEIMDISVNEAEDAKTLMDSIQLKEALTFGLADVWDSSKSTIEDVDIESILKADTDTRKGVESKVGQIAKESLVQELEKDSTGSLYFYNGVDMKTASETVQNSVWDAEFVDEDVKFSVPEDQASKVIFNELIASVDLNVVKKRFLTDEEKKNQIEEKKRKVEEKKKQKEILKKLEWDKMGYVSKSLPDPEQIPSEIDVFASEEEASLHPELEYVSGDASKQESGIILCCVDNSGVWGRGGFFSALSNLSSDIASSYETAGSLDDINLGDSHLIEVKSGLFVALLVCQKRNRDGSVSGIMHDYFSTCLVKIRNFAEMNRLDVHSPRIGAGTPNFNWYGIERLLRSRFVPFVRVVIYYFRRMNSRNNSNSNNSIGRVLNPSSGDAGLGSNMGQKNSFDNLVPIFSNDVIMIHPYILENQPKLARQLQRNIAAYNGVATSVDDSDNDVSTVTVFIVVKEIPEQDIVDLVKTFPTLPVVDFSWIVDCIEKKSRLNVEEYTVNRKYLRN